MAALSIGKLAEKAGCSVATVRFYEEKALLHQAQRLANGRRVYDSKDVDRLTFVRDCRDSGMSLDDIAQLLVLTTQSNQPCAEARLLIEARIADISSKIIELRKTSERLKHLVSGCSAACCGSTPDQCTIFDGLTSSAVA
jgi:MerR family transcriptional regulator, copper efflux regulator